jgi:hypothetical protein
LLEETIKRNFECSGRNHGYAIASGNRQQATGNRQQATGNRQQATGNRIKY